MKSIFVLLATLSAFANTYELSAPISSEADYDYKVQEIITISNVELLSSDIYQRTVTFNAKLNGKLQSFTGKIVDREVNGSDYLYKVQGTLKRDLLANGYACEEFEAFNYVFDGELEVNFDVRHTAFNITKLSVLKEYNWDICHDSTETTIIPYIQQ